MKEQLVQRGVHLFVKVICVKCLSHLGGLDGIVHAYFLFCTCTLVVGSPVVCLCPPFTDSLPQSKPTLREVRDHIVCRVAAHWYHFGLTLRVEDYLLENIKATERGDVQACCTDMLRRWLRGEQATGKLVRSWTSLLQAVQTCIGREEAQSIAESLQAAQ